MARAPYRGLLLLNFHPINKPPGDQRAAHQREQENYVMRKSATKTAEVAQSTSGTRTRTKALGHPTTPNPLRPHDWQPSSWPFRPEDVTPLAWWRTMPADLFGDAEHLL